MPHAAGRQPPLRQQARFVQFRRQCSVGRTGAERPSFGAVHEDAVWRPMVLWAVQTMVAEKNSSELSASSGSGTLTPAGIAGLSHRAQRRAS